MVEGQRMMTSKSKWTPDVLAMVIAAKAPIGDLGGAWMSIPAEEAATSAAGLVDWQLYFLGRHGVLGDVDPDVVSAAAYVFPPDHLRREWNAARDKLTPAEAFDRYVEVCHTWGRDLLANFPEAERLADLSSQLVDLVDVAGLPLFAGWRAAPLPSDTPARCAHLMQLLREHRGSCHGVALVALGMSPLMAILANHGGEQNAKEYGWEPPFPSVSLGDVEHRARVEALTDELAAAPYAQLSQAERNELLALLNAAWQHCFSS
jgi:hypothetical protein